MRRGPNSAAALQLFSRLRARNGATNDKDHHLGDLCKRFVAPILISADSVQATGVAANQRPMLELFSGSGPAPSALWRAVIGRRFPSEPSIHPLDGRGGSGASGDTMSNSRQQQHPQLATGLAERRHVMLRHLRKDDAII